MSAGASATSPSTAIEARADEIAQRLTDEHYERHPEIAERYGAIGRQKCLEDAHYHLRYLVQSMRSNEPEIFSDYVRWARAMLEARGVPAADLRDNLALLDEVVSPIAPEASHYVRPAIALLGTDEGIPSFIDPSNPRAGLVRAYLDHLLDGSRAEASKLIMSAADSGTAIRDLYLDVFRIAQYELGRLWQLNEITVAEEHYCTAATQLIMSQLYPRIFDRPGNGLRLVSSTIGGELHEIGARMLADLFELDGWDTWYLGANVPTRDLVNEVASRQAHLVGLSVTMSYHVSRAIEAIEALRQNPETRDVKILVGGYPFRIAPELWKTIGADGFAMEADEAVDLGQQLVRS